MTKALVVYPNGFMEEVDIEGYQHLKTLIGGMLEVVRFDDDTWVYIDEEGKFKAPFRVNAVATAIATMLRAGLAENDCIVGTAVFVGPADQHGDDTDCPDRMFAFQVLYQSLCPQITHKGE